MKTLIFVNSHPIQYFAPLYKYMNENGVKINVWYCSDETLKGVTDNEFGVKVQWDIPLLEGYQHRFFKNQSWKPSLFNGFFGLINFGMIKQLFRQRNSVIVVHGWHYFSHWLVIMLAWLRGHTVCIRSDMSYNQETQRSGLKQQLKKAWLKYIVFPRIRYFLYIGTQNRLFYQSYGVKDNRLLSCPYAVDNERFQKESSLLKKVAPQLKEKMGIPSGDKIILYTAKYIPKKRPIDLLEAFAKLDLSDVWLVMVGEGELRSEMEAFIKKYNVKKVMLSGFVNQSRIAEYYAVSDVFVMCSSLGENWGLSVNEAMNFDLPLVVSDLTGCAEDLVEEGANGYVFKTGAVEELTKKLAAVIGNQLSWQTTSREIVNNYSFEAMRKTMQPVLNLN